jgi:hypothetical protein
MKREELIHAAIKSTLAAWHSLKERKEIRSQPIDYWLAGIGSFFLLSLISFVLMKSKETKGKERRKGDSGGHKIKENQARHESLSFS